MSKHGMKMRHEETRQIEKKEISAEFTVSTFKIQTDSARVRFCSAGWRPDFSMGKKKVAGRGSGPLREARGLRRGERHRGQLVANKI